MKQVTLSLLLLMSALPLLGQDRELIIAAPAMRQKIAATGKKMIAVAFFTNDQGYGSSFSDYVADTLGELLAPSTSFKNTQLFAIVNRKSMQRVAADLQVDSSVHLEATSIQQLGKQAGADAVLLGNFIVEEKEVSLNLELVDTFTGTSLIRYSIPIAKSGITKLLLGPGQSKLKSSEAAGLPKTKPPRLESHPGIQSHISKPEEEHLLDVAGQIGLTAIEKGGYAKEEDDRFSKSVRDAKQIRLLMPNASSLSLRFKDDFKEFFARPHSSMKVLFATADSVFYKEETEMTNLDLESKEAEPAAKINQGLVELSRHRLASYAKSADNIEFKYFDTQFRLPIIITVDQQDNEHCFLTIRLSPNESPQSVRLEFDGAKNGFADSCSKHFERMWHVSKSDPGPQVGQETWSRTDLYATFGTLFGAVSCVIGVLTYRHGQRKQAVAADQDALPLTNNVILAAYQSSGEQVGKRSRPIQTTTREESGSLEPADASKEVRPR